MVVLRVKPNAKQQFIENGSILHIPFMNCRTGRAVHGHVMHRSRSWPVFSASLLGVNWVLVALHFRRILLILSVSTLGFFIFSFSAVLASDSTGQRHRLLRLDPGGQQSS